MVSRIQRPVASFAVLVGLAILTTACQKVPLLAPGGSVITLTSSVTVLPINGSADLIAQVIEPAGTPPQRGTLVSFTTTLGSIEPSQAETDISGRVIVKFMAGPGSGSANITAISGGVAVTSANALKILVGTAAVGNVRVSASPTLLPAIGGSSTITAQALDINGNALSSAPVSFSTTAGTLDQGFATTDQSGTAAVILRTSTAATVTAAVGAQAGSTTPPATGGTTPTTPAASGQASGSVTVNVSGAPTLVITPPATAPSAGLPSTFTFAATIPATNGSAIRNVTVNWGDGQVQDLGAITTAAVAHTFRSPGSYTVTGTATDSFGNVVNVSITVAVNPKPQPVVTITATTSNPTAGTDMTFTGSIAPAAGTGTVIQSASVDYGDGTKTDLGPVSGTVTLHHVYQLGGNYTVVLSATDSNGGVGTGVTTVFVQTATPLTVLLSATPTFGTTTTTQSFTATVIGQGNSVVVNYAWNFGDGSSANTTGNQTTHQYPHPSGPFTVTVTVTTSTGQTATGSTVVSN